MRTPILITALLLSASLSTAQRRFPRVEHPTGNPPSFAKTNLGKALFFEEQLSSTRTVACATCHTLEKGGSDMRSLLPSSVHPGPDGRFNTRDDVRGSRGVIGSNADGSYRSVQHFGLNEQVTNRRAMPVINKAFQQGLFWDGRAGSTFRDPITNNVVLTGRAALESQAVQPITNTAEMSHFGVRWTDVVARLRAVRPLAMASDIPAQLAAFIGSNGYPELFRQAFGTTDITPARIAMAIANYERTLISNQNRVDDFLRGNRNALTQQEQRGRNIFAGRQAQCTGCHGGALQTDNRFHYTGVTPQNEDIGRQAVTNDPRDRGRMRTPSMRNVELRAPYFHNGSARTLMDVVNFYDRGGDFDARNKDRRIRRLRLSQGQKNDLVAFLRAFTDNRVRSNLPPFDRPKLYSETGRMPVLFGTGTAGSGNMVPQMVAIEPGLIGNSSLTFGIKNAHGGSAALLALDTTANRAGLPVAGIRVHLGLSPSLTLFNAVALQGSGAGRGWASTSMPVPNVPGLRGAHLYGQWIVADSGVQRFAASEGVDVPIF